MKIRKKLIVITLFSTFALSFSAKAQTTLNDLQGIKLLQSTRKDVEKLFGLPMKGWTDLYDTDKERISVQFAKGTCKGKTADEWKVPKDTVLTILVSPKQSLNVSTLINKLQQHFEREKDWEMGNVFFYRNKDKSIGFETRLLPDGIEELSYVVYRPGESDNSLRCKPNVSSKQRKEKR